MKIALAAKLNFELCKRILISCYTRTNFGNFYEKLVLVSWGERLYTVIVHVLLIYTKSIVDILR
jgi:hypothetical protein